MAQVLAFETSIGWIAAAWSEGALCRVSIGHQRRRDALRLLPDAIVCEGHPQLERLRQDIQRYLLGEEVGFLEIPISLRGFTTFQRRVLQACRAVGYGRTTTYGELARQVGSPQAARAVGQVMAHNPLPLVIPCHRVVGAGDRMTGFSAPRGIQLKKLLLALESSQPKTCDRRQLGSSCMSSA